MSRVTSSLAGFQVILIGRFWVIPEGKDLARSVDYLETRTDIDRSRIAYHGISLGSIIALPCIAMEPRLKTAILQGGGLARLSENQDPFLRDRRVNIGSDAIPVLDERISYTCAYLSDRLAHG